MDHELPQVVRLARAGDAQVLSLAGVINIMAADALLAAARTAAGGEGALRVDCAEVEYFDTCALQILLALRRELEGQGRALVFAHLRPQAAADIALAGLEHEFECARDGVDRTPASSAT